MMRCLSLWRDANSNANGVQRGGDFQVGESFPPSLKPSVDWVQGNALPPLIVALRSGAATISTVVWVGATVAE